MGQRLSLALMIAVLAIAGCNGGMKGPIEGRDDTHDWPQISFTDEDLRNRTAIRQPRVTHDDAGLMYVMLPIRSTSDRQFTIEYRATFYDENRAVVQETTWFPLTLSPRTQQTISVNSTSPRADDFQLDIRYAK